MALEVGSRLCHYEVTALIGEGGMGQVYQATDTKLNRQVALKILPEAFASDPDRLARFEREAQVLASLNHPGIAAIYGIEEQDDTRALVLELVEGPTLADRIAQGPIPTDEVLPIAKQIAEALEAAHEAGVIHRDLKPANIKLRPDGAVKVLDFGLAKALDPSPEGDPSQSPTLTAAATQMGVIMGTAAYMSPEQARGKLLDRRTDIWSFGCVFYEILTGRSPFLGETLSDTIAKILDRDPDWQALPTNTPVLVRRLLRRCLDKDPKDRLRDIGDARVEIREAVTAPLTGEVTAVPSAPHDVGWRKALPLALGTLIVGSLATGLAVWIVRAPLPGSPARFVVSAPPSATPSEPTDSTELAISPDGRLIAYRAVVDGEEGLYLRHLDRLEGELRPGTAGARSIFFSPDGTEVGFAMPVDGTLKKIPVAGGPAITLCATAGVLRGASWGPDDTIIFAVFDTGLFRVSAAGGEPEVLTAPDDTETHDWPEVLPDGRAVLFATGAVGSLAPNPQLAVLDLETGDQRVLPVNGSHPRYVSPGHLVYSTENSLWAVGFDTDQREVVGDPIPVLEGVAMRRDGGANVAVSADGALVYRPGRTQTESRTLVWVDRDGREEPLGMPPRAYDWPRASPDGQRVVVDTGTIGGDLFLHNVETQVEEQFTFDPAVDQYPLWSKDGSAILFSSTRAGGPGNLYMKAADGGGSPEPLSSSPLGGAPFDLSVDGETLVLAELDPATSWDIATLRIGDGSPTEKLLHTDLLEGYPAISPNSRWILYTSDEPGGRHIYVRPFPDVTSGGQWLITTQGEQPRWGPDGGELFYRGPQGIMAVQVEETGDTFERGTPTLLCTRSVLLFRHHELGRWAGRPVSADQAGCGDWRARSKRHHLRPEL